MAKKRNDGRKEAKYTYKGKRYSIYGSTKAERDKKWEVKKKELEMNSFTASKDLSVGEYLDRWLDSRQLSLKESTMLTYRKLVRRMSGQALYGDMTFGMIILRDLEPQNVRDLQVALAADLKTRSVNDHLSLLKKAITAACNERIIPWNPTAPIERLKTKETEEPARDTIHRCLTQAEVSAFMAAAEGSWYYNLYRFLLYSGLRIGEASALYVGDVDAKEIRVRKIVERTSAGFVVKPWSKTDAGVRDVPLLPEAREAWRDQVEVSRALFGENNVISIAEPVFRKPKGGIIREDSVNVEIRKICRAIGIDDFTTHAFRVTFISRCVDNNMPVTYLMEIVGHKDVQMTLGLYAHANKDKKREAVLSVNF